MSGLMERLARCGGDPARQREGERGGPFSSETAGDAARFGASVRPAPAAIARLREKLERAARENNIELVRETMDEVVALLGRSLPKVLPPPAPGIAPPAPQPAAGAGQHPPPPPAAPPPPRGKTPPAPTESLASRLARALETVGAPSPPGAGPRDGEGDPLGRRLSRRP